MSATRKIRPSPLSLALLQQAWDHVRRRGEAAGVDGIDLDTFGADLAGQLEALSADLEQGVYQPQAARAVWLPKPSGGQRRIAIATVRDRVAQSAGLLVLLPRIEPLLHPASFAYRRGLGVQDALLRICALRDQGLRWALRADVRDFFDSARHDRLFDMLSHAGVPEALLDLARLWLQAPILDPADPRQASGRMNAVGLPQGYPLSPLLSNLYLTPFDRDMTDRGWELTRYADDFCVCCAAREKAEQAREEAREALRALDLSLAEEKCEIRSFDDGFSFLGARFQGQELIPATPHPYEQDFTPPPPRAPRRPPVQQLPSRLVRTLYLQEQGSLLRRHGERLVVTRGEKTLCDLPALRVDQVFLFGAVQLTAAAMAFCLEKGLPVFLFSQHGRYHGVLAGEDRASFEQHQMQFDLLRDEERRKGFARAVAEGKIANSLELLRQHQRNHPEAELGKAILELEQARKRVPHVKGLDEIRGVEGAAAAAYFRGLARCFRGAIAFTHRARRPPTDPANSLLSFGYSMLSQNIHGLLLARGLNPYVGLFHEPGRGHPALASDLVEELRAPIVDALVLTLANRGRLGPAGFHYEPGNPPACLMNDDTRVGYIHAFERKLASRLHHPDAPDVVDWRRVMDLQVCRLRRFIAGQTKTYVPWTRGGAGDADPEEKEEEE